MPPMACVASIIEPSNHPTHSSSDSRTPNGETKPARRRSLAAVVSGLPERMSPSCTMPPLHPSVIITALLFQVDPYCPVKYWIFASLQHKDQ